MVGVSIARRYARALLEVAVSEGRIDEVLSELAGLAEQVQVGLPLYSVFESPSVTRRERRAVAEQVAERLGFSEITTNLLRLLSDRERLTLVPDIARIYRDLADEAQGRVRAQVSAPLPLTEDQVARLRSVLEQVTGKTIDLRVDSDPELLGGLVAQVGDTTFDGSLKTQLRSLRDAALSA